MATGLWDAAKNFLVASLMGSKEGWPSGAESRLAVWPRGQAGADRHSPGRNLSGCSHSSSLWCSAHRLMITCVSLGMVNSPMLTQTRRKKRNSIFPFLLSPKTPLGKESSRPSFSLTPQFPASARVAPRSSLIGSLSASLSTLCMWTLVLVSTWVCLGSGCMCPCVRVSVCLSDEIGTLSTLSFSPDPCLQGTSKFGGKARWSYSLVSGDQGGGRCSRYDG